jgi:hypothetical protein
VPYGPGVEGGFHQNCVAAQRVPPILVRAASPATVPSVMDRIGVPSGANTSVPSCLPCTRVSPQSFLYEPSKRSGSGNTASDGPEGPGSRDGASTSSRNTQRAPHEWDAHFFVDPGVCAGFALFNHTV